MNHVVIVGVDTDAGKSTLSLLWLAAFPTEWSYWKPVETGESDTHKIRRLVPGVISEAPVARFDEPVAPPLAARRNGTTIPSARQIATKIPNRSRLLIETFGGPLSPLNEHELQIELIREFKCPTVLVCSSAIGAIGRTLAALEALTIHGAAPSAVVLIGHHDLYAHEQIEKHGKVLVFSLHPPDHWTVDGIRDAARQQLQVLEQIQLIFTPPCTLHDDFWKLDRSLIWHPYTPLRGADDPLPIVGAQDEFLELADGRRIIDGISSWWTILHGHREPRLMAALREATGNFDHVLFAGTTHPDAIRVADLLLQTAPWNSGGGRIFFSDNGSTAVEVALKMAYQYWHHRGQPRRTLFIGFEDCYHGDTFGAMSVSRDPLFFGKFEPLLFETMRIPVSPERLDEVLELASERVAAIIIEPLVQGAGGMKMHSPEVLRSLFEVTRKHGTLFIADEVMTGCYRTGTMWAYNAANIAPDLICTAKTLAGGILSLAATLASPEIVSAFDTADRERPFFHGHSFTAHPLACAIAATNLELLRNETPSAPARMQGFWHQAFDSLRGHSRVSDIRIRGTIAAIEVDVPGGYLAETAREMRRRSLEHGVFLRPLGNVLYAMPPFNCSTKSMDTIASAMIDCVESLK